MTARTIQWIATAAIGWSCCVALSKSLATEYTYDAIGRLVTESYPDGSHVFYTYDSAGNLLGRRQLAPRENPQADLGVAITANPNPANSDEEVSLTLTVTNNGPDTATNVSVSNTVIPSAVESPVSTSSQGLTEISGGVLTANLGTIPNGGTATVTITGTANGSEPIALDPEIASPEDGNAANNTATLRVNVGPSQLADLSMTLEAGPNPAFLPGRLTYQATVTNLGPADSASTTVTLTLPAGATFLSASHPATQRQHRES